MKSHQKIPQFSFDLACKNKNSPSILVAHVEFDKIKNVAEFIKELGYTDEIRAGGTLPEEFIWETYTRSGAAKSVRCLQPKIIEYLFKHSAKFRKEYGSEYVNIIGKCGYQENDDSELCVACPMHPNFLYLS